MPKFLAKLFEKSIMLKSVLMLALIHSAFFAFSIGPHELALLVNDSSLDSVTLANYYSKLRGIPECNIIKVDIPEEIFNPRTQIKISQENFSKYIWEPFQAQLKERNLDSQILAVAISCDFPTTILSVPETSITGVFFLHNNLPSSNIINSGEKISPLFVGPVEGSTQILPALALDEMCVRLKEKMPLPAMMLAYTGPRGMTYDSAKKSIVDAYRVDYSMPKGTIYFETNDDVRTKCRQWEYEISKVSLAQNKYADVVITNMPPPVDMPLVGYMTGNRYVKPLEMKLLPGCYADHLTSFGAAFGEGGHTKITKWIEAGAAFTSGAVTEPYAIWTKFSSALIFAHYLNGFTAIESFYLSVASPYQLLALGDPLAKPWAQKFEIAMNPIPEKISGKQILSVDESLVEHNVKNRYYWFIDGRKVGSGKRFSWNTNKEKNGKHKVRLVVCKTFGSVRQQRFVEKTVVVAN